MTAWPHISLEVIVKGFRKCCNPVQWMGRWRCGMAVKRMGMLGVSVRKMKTLTVQVETVMLIGNSR
jgi:hypothetical protein